MARETNNRIDEMLDTIDHGLWIVKELKLSMDRSELSAKLYTLEEIKQRVVCVERELIEIRKTIKFARTDLEGGRGKIKRSGKEG